VTPRQHKQTQSLLASRRRTIWLQQTSSEQSAPSASAQTPASRQPSETAASKSPSAPKSFTAIWPACFLLLTGCASTTHSLPPVAVKRVPPAAAMVPCSAPSDLRTGTLAEVTTKLLETAESLAECRTKHDELRTFIGR